MFGHHVYLYSKHTAHTVSRRGLNTWEVARMLISSTMTALRICGECGSKRIEESSCWPMLTEVCGQSQLRCHFEGDASLRQRVHLSYTPMVGLSHFRLSHSPTVYSDWL